MAKNYIQPGEVMDYKASSAAVASGDVVIAGSIAGVALVDIAKGATGSVQIAGVFNLPLTDTAAVAQGTKVYWDGDGVTATATENDALGIAFRAAAAGDGSIDVKLNV